MTRSVDLSRQLKVIENKIGSLQQLRKEVTKRRASLFHDEIMAEYAKAETLDDKIKLFIVAHEVYDDAFEDLRFDFWLNQFGLFYTSPVNGTDQMSFDITSAIFDDDLSVDDVATRIRVLLPYMRAEDDGYIKFGVSMSDDVVAVRSNDMGVTWEMVDYETSKPMRPYESLEDMLEGLDINFRLHNSEVLV